MHKHALIITILTIITLWIGIFQATATNQSIIITEIGAFEINDGCEWIEIHNTSSSTIDIAGWKFTEPKAAIRGHKITTGTSEDFLIAPQDYAIIAQNPEKLRTANCRKSYTTSSTTIFDSTWQGLTMNGATIGLKDAEGNTIDSITYPQVGTSSLERIDFTKNEWQSHPTGHSFGAQNFWHSQKPVQTHGNGSPTTTPTSSPPIIEEPPEEIPEKNPSATTGTIHIHEFLPNPTTGTEWIILINKESYEISLVGWSVEDAIGIIALPTSTIKASNTIQINLPSKKLNNTGDTITLKDPNQNIIDQLTFNKTQKGIPITREELLNPKPEPIEEEQKNETPTAVEKTATTTPTITASYPNITINELVSDPADGEVEFIELYNPKASDLSLDGWWIEDGSEAKTTINGTIPAEGFFIIEKPKGNLNNKGDQATLFNPNGKEVDSITYGNWDDGNPANNAPAASDPMSLARVIDGLDADNDIYDFKTTSIITKGKRNIISEAVQVIGSSSQSIQQSNAIVIINEIYPNPPGSDSEDEFIELYNLGPDRANLSGWKLGDASKKRYTLNDAFLDPNKYLVIKRNKSNIALNNSNGDEVKLFNTNKQQVDIVKYTDKAEETTSYARTADNTWVWSVSSTPGTKNKIKEKNTAPIIVIQAETEIELGKELTLDASDTTDPDGNPLRFTWKTTQTTTTGEVTTLSFNETGPQTITLTVADTKATSTQDIIIQVTEPIQAAGGFPVLDLVEKIEISEIFPNPKGKDDNEFIELYNPTNITIHLANLKLDDEEGGSKAYRFGEKDVIEAKEYLAIPKNKTNLTLNNTTDSARLLYPDGTVIQEIPYTDVMEESAYIMTTSGIWTWSTTITPGSTNIKTDNASQKSVAQPKVKTHGNASPAQTTLEQVRTYDIGDLVTLQGTVAVKPGVLSTQYFYIVGSPGIQVYMHKKEFPNLVIGDVVSVTGELKESNGNLRIKVTNKHDMQKLNHTAIPEPKQVEIQEINETYEGWLLKIHGEITELKGSYMYVDDGTEEIKIYFKRGSGINKKELQLGDLVYVSGLNQQTKTGYQLLPRNKKDIEKTGVAETATRVAKNSEKKASPNKQPYFIATIVAIIIAILLVILKSKKPIK